MSAWTTPRPRSAGASALVVVGILCSARPLGLLFTAHPWEGPLFVTALVVAAVGVLMRPLGALATIAAQLLAWASTLLVLFARDTAAAGIIPTGATLARALEVVGDAATTITTSPAPAPATFGITAVFTAGFALAALVADVLAATFRRALAACIPLLVPYLAAVANVVSPLPWYHPLLLFVVFALLVYEGRNHELRARLGTDPDAGGRPLAGVAVTVVAIVGAFAIASAVPYLPARFVADGLGRTGGIGTVGFTPAPDLTADLRNTDRTPILAYTTDDPAPPPIKVAVAGLYRDGRWNPRPANARPSTSPSFSPPPGLSPTTEVLRHRFTVDETRMDAPFLPAPAPVVSGTVKGAQWTADVATGTLVTDARPREYAMEYLTVIGLTGGQEIPDVASLLMRGVITEDDIDTAAVTAAVQTAAEEATASATTPAERADAIQRWLRDGPTFRYSLDVPDLRGRAPVDAFLEDRVGYCVQFATTMVLMARVQGLPARLATGFLPGEVEGDRRVVRASDAHAWVEVYLKDLGWVRYDPTPTRGLAPPTYAPAPVPTGSEDPEPSRRPTSTASERPEGAPTTGTDAPTATTAAPGSGSATPGTALGGVLGGLAVVAALLAVIASPALLTRLRRRRRSGCADSPRAQVDLRWRDLESDLADLGVESPPSATVRRRAAAWADHLGRDSGAAPDAGEDVEAALARLVSTVERARYAGPSEAITRADVDQVARDAGTVLHRARARTPRRRRIRAFLLPRNPL